jgi:hypothetical protein
LLWGSEARLGELFPGDAVEITPRHFNFRYRSAGHFVEVFRNVYGPTHKAFAALDEEARPRLEQGILALLREADRGGGRGLVVPSAGGGDQARLAELRVLQPLRAEPGAGTATLRRVMD